jgi:methylmalonyl-CoA mutase
VVGQRLVSDMDELDFSVGFDPPSFGDWRAAVAKALSGAPLSSLETPLYENFATAPIYTPADSARFATLSGEMGAAPFIRGKVPSGVGRPWAIIQFLDHLDIGEANRQLKSDLVNGAGAFWLQLGGNIPYGGAFLGARTLKALERVFDGVRLGDAKLYLSGGFDTVAGAALVKAMWEKNGQAPEAIGGCAGFDPISIIAAHGLIPAERQKIMEDPLDAAFYLRDKGCKLRPFLASGRAWHQAGGSAREELAYTLASAVFYGRALLNEGWSLEETSRAIQFSLTADVDLFLTIAKFRAMRALWSRVCEVAGFPAEPPALIAEMSFRAITERDPYVNLLRGTSAAFGAAVGGADGVLLIPFNTRHGTPDAFSRGLARNTQLILQEEAGLGRVADAAGGSWYVEDLTHRLAESAWAEFRRIEAAGGMVSALEQGIVLRALHDVRSRRQQNIARVRDKITGVSAFPELCEQPIYSRPEDLRVNLALLDDEGEVPSLPPAALGKRFGAMVAAAQAGATLKGLERACETLMERYDFIPPTSERAAEPFERLRTASDRALARIRVRPPVFLANLGRLADYNLAATWALNFFAAGGVEVMDEGGYTDFAVLIRKFQRSPAPIVCICGSAKTLTAMPGAAVALKKAGAVAVFLAASRETLSLLPEEDKRAIDRIIYEGCDAIKILSDLHEAMRVKEHGAAETEDYDDEDDLPAPRRGRTR